MVTKLPWELIVDILSRLPAKDLLRCRSVSQPWRSLIDGPGFIKLHLTRSSETRIVYGGRNDLFWIDPEALERPPQRLVFPIDTGSGIDIFGGCDGLVALQNSDGNIAIWNPMTREHRALANSMSEMKQYPFLAVFQVALMGFGYDPIGDDYKIMRMVNYDVAGRPVHSVVKVYTLKADAWRTVCDFPSHFYYERRNGRLVGTALHWVVTRNSDESDALLAFDLAGEEHREVPLPVMDLSVIKKPFMRLASLGGRLCVSMLGEYDALFRRTSRVDVWVMREYGVRESWTKLFSMAPSLAAAPSFMFVEPVVYLNGGGDRILLNWDGEKFAAYDMKTKRVRDAGGSGIVPIVDTHVCLVSLVGVGRDGGGSRKKGDRRLSSNKKRDDFLSKGFKLVL